MIGGDPSPAIEDCETIFDGIMSISALCKSTYILNRIEFTFSELPLALPFRATLDILSSSLMVEPLRIAADTNNRRSAPTFEVPGNGAQSLTSGTCTFIFNNFETDDVTFCWDFFVCSFLLL